MLASIPQITLTSYAVDEGTATLQLQAVVSDADNDLAKVEFSLDNFATTEGEVLAGAFVNNGNGTFTANFTLDLVANGLTDGFSTHAYYARVTDADDNSSTDDANIDINPVSPEILSADVSGGEYACSPVVFDVTATNDLPRQSTTLTIELFGPKSLAPINVEVVGGVFSRSISGLDPGNYTYFLSVTDSDGDVGGGVGDVGTFTVGTGGSASLTASIENEPAGNILEGGSVTLNSLVTQGCGSGAVSYLWEARLGTTVVAASTDPNFTFSPTDNGSYEVTLTATSGSLTASDNVTINALNVAPSITAVSATQSVSGGADVTLSGTITDAGTADTVTISVVWETGGTPELITAVGSGGSFSFSASHTYTTPGDKAISVTVADDDGDDAVAAASAAVAVALSNDGTLAIQGGGGGDDVTITSPSAGTVQVESSLLGTTSTFTGVSLIKVALGDGNDSLIVSSAITTTILALGGAGDDILVGGGGNNALVGGAGTDLISGRGARDVLIGGEGSDALAGSGGQDILVDGATANDGDEAALLAILAEWTSGDDSLASYQQRIRHLSGIESGGLNGSYTISALDNSTFDLLFGGSGNDWIIQHGGDISFG